MVAMSLLPKGRRGEDSRTPGWFSSLTEMNTNENEGFYVIDGEKRKREIMNIAIEIPLCKNAPETFYIYDGAFLGDLF